MLSQEVGKKIIAYMKSKNYKVDAINIVFVEDVQNPDTLIPTKGVLDVWDDACIIVRDTGEVLLSAWATCEPGKKYTYHPLNSKGAFRIKHGQYVDCWQFGKHRKQNALVQCGTLTGVRDGNKNGIRDSADYIDVGNHFAVNIHTTGDGVGNSPANIGGWSAGCMVLKNSTTFYNKFMPIVRGMSKSNKRTATIIGADDLASFSQ